MMTSQNNIRLIEKYLGGDISFVDKVLFESRLAVDTTLKRDFYIQKKIHDLVKIYHREKLKEELESMHRDLFSDPGKINFQRSIKQLFK